MSTENEIRAAAVNFYAALNRMAKGEAGGWRMVHHHTDASPAMLDVLARLKAAA